MVCFFLNHLWYIYTSGLSVRFCSAFLQCVFAVHFCSAFLQFFRSVNFELELLIAAEAILQTAKTHSEIAPVNEPSELVKSQSCKMFGQRH